MTANDHFSRDLEAWLADDAATTAPLELHAAAIGRVGRGRQRPRWLVGLRGGGDAPPVGSLRGPAVRIAMAVVVGMLLLVLVVAAIAGALQSMTTDPMRGNGAIAYSVFENRQRAGQTSLTYLMDADGSDDRQVAQGTCPTFSRNGRVMAHRSSWGDDGLTIESADGSARTVLPILADTMYREWSYALSPDGTQVAWFKPIREIEFPTADGGSEGGGYQNELWVSPIAGGPGVRLVPTSTDPTESFGHPTWSPDGRTIGFEGRIAVASADGHSHRSAVYAVRSDGSAHRTLSTRPLAAYDAFGLSWSPDGRYLAFVGLPDGSTVPRTNPDAPLGDPPTDVFVIAADGTGERNITRSATFETRPGWSPDGSRLAYLTADDWAEDRTVEYRLATLRMDGPVPSGPAIDGPLSESFAWSPDSSLLLSVLSPTIVSVDAEFRESPRVLVDVRSLPQTDPLHPATYSIESCAPSWRSVP